MMCPEIRVICAIFWSKICVCAIFLRFSISARERTPFYRQETLTRFSEERAQATPERKLVASSIYQV